MPRTPSKSPPNSFILKPPSQFGSINEADRLFQHALAMLNQGRMVEARQNLQKVVNLNAKHFDAFHIMGIIAAQDKEFEVAKSLFENAIKLNPNKAAFYCNLGNVLKELNSFEKAIEYYNMAIKLKKDYAMAYLNQSLAYFELKNFYAALNSCKQAINIKEDYAEAYYNQGNILDELKLFDEALKSYEKAIELNQVYAEGYLGRGNVFKELKKFDEALKSYDKAIEIKNDYAKAYFNRGNLLNEIKRFDEALKNYDKAIEINQLYAEAYSNKAVLLNDMKRFDEAIKNYDKAIELLPYEASNYYNKSLLLLSLKEFEFGWQLYDWRWRNENLGFPSLISDKPKLIDLHTSKDKKLLIWGEQGIGDQVMYAGMLDELLNLAPASVVISDKRLITLFQRSFPHGNFIQNSINIKQLDYDEHLPIADLGKYFRSSTADFDNVRKNYLIPDNQMAKKIRSELIGNNKFLCGVAWNSKTFKIGVEKSIRLEDFLPILEINQIAFVSLQYGNIQEQLIDFNRINNLNILECKDVDNFNDIDGHAALIEACDFVVTISNTSAHISGAVGKETYLICPSGKGFLWYWSNQMSGKSLWYPSVTIFEQCIPGRWIDAIEQVKKIIEKKLVDLE